MEPAILVHRLTVAFGERWRRSPVLALDQVSLSVAAGSIQAVLGPNGSGKTTLLRVLAGVQRPTSGTATVLGSPPTARALVPRVGFQPEEPLPWPNFTGREHLVQMAVLAGLPSRTARERADVWLETMELSAAAHRRVKTYSTGMTKRLGLAAALLTEPQVLLLDEPTAGLDPIGSSLVMELLQKRAAAGTAIVLASHHLMEVESICDRVLALVDGSVRAEDTLDGMLAKGTDAIEVRGLDDGRWPAVQRALEDQGLEVVGRHPARQHLFALFRAWAQRPEDPS